MKASHWQNLATETVAPLPLFENNTGAIVKYNIDIQPYLSHCMEIRSLEQLL